jgi:LmbE family N-acetylglucosaminyl deacetylase
VPARVTCFAAHQDDDLLFLSPDLAAWIEAGLPAQTVYVTAGEYNGWPGQTREEYAAARQEGIRTAYAELAGVPNDWTVGTVTVAGRPVEVDTLTAAPQLQVIFLCLPDGGDNLQPNALPNLLSGALDTARTIVPTGSPVDHSLTYTGPQLVAVLTALMTELQPSVIRHQDPLPNPHHGGDHADHTAVANFVATAAGNYRPATGHVQVVPYRDYNIANSAPNLVPAQVTAKSQVFATYQAYDPHAQAMGWTSAMYHRWPVGVSWVGRDSDGRLELFAVADGQLLIWFQAHPGGGWTGPVGHGGGPLAGHVAVSANADGRLQVFALRVDTHQIVTSWQTAPDLAFSGWLSLGNPSGASTAYTGVPVAGRHADGRLAVWCRNTGGGVSTRAQQAANGSFGGWVDLGGGPDLVDDGIDVIANDDGRLEVFAATGTGLRHWFQGTPNGAFQLNQSLPASVPASAPTAGKHADGRLQTFYRSPSDGHLHASVQATRNGGWSAAIADLGGAGYAQPAVVRAPDGRLLLCGRRPGGGLQVCRQSAPSGAFGGWTPLPGTVFGQPAAALESDGTISIFAFGPDTRPVNYRQTAAGAAAPFADPVPVPGPARASGAGRPGR